MKILGIDVCTGFCSAAVVDGDRVLARLQEPMTKGHVERLAPMVQEGIREAGIAPTDLDGIAVTTGPGSFTGARLGVSFARGLALSLGIPAVGVSVFEAMAGTADGEPVVVALDGKRDSVFVQVFEGGEASLPVSLTPQTVSNIAPEAEFSLLGSGADLFLAHASSDVQSRARVRVPEPVVPEFVAQLGLRRIARGEVSSPAPLYLREADAKPQAIVSLG